jgi:Tol biopolymer transport system component
MVSDGSNQTQLTSSPEVEREPKLSPDGTKIVFVRANANANVFPAETLWVMNANGANAHQVFAPPETRVGPPAPPGSVMRDRDPTWSPDGAQIAFVREAFNTPTGIIIMNADGSDAHALIPFGEPARQTDLAWSPDGTSLAYAYDYIGQAGNHVLVVDMDGSGTAVGELTGFHLPFDARTFDEQPAWSPDSSKIAFFGNLLSEPTGLWVIGADGSNPAYVSSGVTPAWSPDGDRIAFGRDGSIWTMKPDGTDQVSIATGTQPSWGP